MALHLSVPFSTKVLKDVIRQQPGLIVTWTDTQKQQRAANEEAPYARGPVVNPSVSNVTSCYAFHTSHAVPQLCSYCIHCLVID